MHTSWAGIARRVGVSLVVACSYPPSEAYPEEPRERSFSLDSRYLIQGPSNAAVGQFGIEMVNLATLPADWIGPGGGLREVGRGVVVLLGSFYLGEAFSLAYHEYGHGTRNAAVGFGSLYGFGTLRTPEDAEKARLAGGTSDDFFSYYVRSLFAGSGGFTLRAAGSAAPLSEQRRLELSWEGARRAGGMNNEMFYTELIEDEIYRNGGHIGFFPGYVKGKLSASRFSSSASEFGDINRLVSFYETRGYSIDKDDIDAASRAAFFLSATSYQVTYQTLRMFFGRSFRFEPWDYRGLQLPNAAFYMNRTGLSLKIRSAYRTGSWRFPFAAERVFEGEPRSEFTLGATKQSGALELSLVAVVGRRLDLELGVRYRPSGRLEVSGGYTLLDERNLNGARQIPSIGHGSSYHGLHARVSFIY